MEILTDRWVNDAFLQVKSDPKYIDTLTKDQKIAVLDLVIKKMEYVEELHSMIVGANPKMKDYNIDNISDYKELRQLKEALQDKRIIKEITTLKEACIGSEQYEFIKAWFVKEGLCNPVTFSWKDRKNGHKSILSLYLKDLSGKHYTKILMDTEIQNIARNDFNVEVGISTIQHIKDPETEIPPFTL